jgi:hypothetical protein
MPHEDSMARIRVSIQLRNAVEDIASNWVQVNIADEFQEIRIFLNHDALVPVLEEVTLSLMPPVVPDRVASHQSTHHSGEAHSMGPKKKVKMIRHETPSKQLNVSLRNQVGKALKKGFSILCIPKDFPTFDASGHHMLQNVRNV